MSGVITGVDLEEAVATALRLGAADVGLLTQLVMQVEIGALRGIELSRPSE